MVAGSTDGSSGTPIQCAGAADKPGGTPQQRQSHVAPRRTRERKIVAKKASSKRRQQRVSGSATNGALEPGALVQWVLRESYLESTEDLRHYAEKVKYFNQQKKAVREYLKALRCVRSQVLGEARKRRLDITRPSADDAKQLSRLLQQHVHAFEVGPVEIETGLPARVPADHVDSLDAISDEIEHWEETLHSIGDDAQLANVDLQNILQKQQQVLQMMSNISKMLHDNAMSIIRKIGG